MKVKHETYKEREKKESENKKLMTKKGKASRNEEMMILYYKAVFEFQNLTLL